MKSSHGIGHRALLAVAILLSLASPALAGVVYEIEVKDHEQSPPKTESIEAAVEGRHLKMGIAPRGQGGQGGDMIFRGDRREVIVVDHDNRSYHVMDEATARSLAGQVGAAMGMMKGALEGLTQEQREAVEKAMKDSGMAGGMAGMGAAKRSVTEVRKTGDRAEMNGYPCVRYEVLRDGRTIRELWVTDWSNIEGGGEARDAFMGMADFFQEMLDMIGDAAGPGADGFLDGIGSYTESFGNGFPVVTREFDGSGELEDESTLRGARRQTLDPDAFEPPAGYKRRQMFGSQ